MIVRKSPAGPIACVNSVFTSTSWSSSIRTLMVQSFGLAVGLIGAVHVGVRSVRSLNEPGPGSEAEQATVQKYVSGWPSESDGRHGQIDRPPDATRGSGSPSGHR